MNGYTIYTYSRLINMCVNYRKNLSTSSGDSDVSVRPVNFTLPVERVLLLAVKVTAIASSKIESRVNDTLRGEASALFHDLLRRGVSAFVPPPSIALPLAFPMLPWETIGLSLRSRTLGRETLVLQGVRRWVHSIIQARVCIWEWTKRGNEKKKTLGALMEN